MEKATQSFGTKREKKTARNIVLLKSAKRLPVALG